MSKFHPQKIFNSLIYCTAYIGIGLIHSSLGWSTLEFQKKTNSSDFQIGLIFTLRGVGFVVGNIISGICIDYLFESKFIKKYVDFHFIYSFLLFLSILVMIFIPVIENYILLLIVHFILGFVVGTEDIVGQVLILKIWKEKVNPWMQFLHFCFGIGNY